MLHKAKTARLVITLYRLSVVCRPTAGRLIVYVLGKTCRPSVGRQMADSWPTVGRQTADSRPTDGRQSANRQPTVGQQTTDSRPTGFLGSSSSQLPWLLHIPFIFVLSLALKYSKKCQGIRDGTWANMNRGSLHTRSFRRIHLLVLGTALQVG